MPSPLQLLAAGEPTLSSDAPRRFQQLFAALEPVFTHGSFTPKMLATGGLLASAWDARERGGVVFVQNPTDVPLTGSVFPGIPEIALDPGEAFAWVHDLPIGPSERYLSAYAGLVKCDANFLTAHLRPDPFVGARVFIYGTPGTEKSIVLFGGGRGEEAKITFTDAPQIIELAESQVVALPDALADSVYLPEIPQTALNPTTIGDWLLWPDGALERPADWPETGTLDGWLYTSVSIPAPTGARLDGFSGSLWLGGASADPANFTLAAGENALLLRAETPLTEPPLLIPDGACYLLELTRWRSRPRR